MTYKPLRQKNVYYVDLDNQVYSGYVETEIEVDSACVVDYYVSGLVVECVSINGTDLKEKSRVYFDKNNRHMPDRGILSVDVNDCIFGKQSGRTVIVIRIVYLSGCVPSVAFYSKNSYRECIANWRLSAFFPIVRYSGGYQFDLYYALPNDKYIVISPGTFKAITDSPRIYNYRLEYALPENVYFVVGCFESVEIATSGSKFIYMPVLSKCFDRQRSGTDHSGDDDEYKNELCMRYSVYSYKDVILEIQDDIRFLEGFFQIEYPDISIVFVLSEVDYENILYLGTLPFSNSIEQGFLFREAIHKILVSNLLKCLRSSNYISIGLKYYLCGHLIRSVFGANEMLFRIKRDLDFVVQNDINECPLDSDTNDQNIMAISFRASYDSPLTTTTAEIMSGLNAGSDIFNTVNGVPYFGRSSCEDVSVFGVQCAHGAFFKKKSKLFFYVMENNLSQAFMQKIIAMTLKLARNGSVIDTAQLIKIIKDCTGKDMEYFFDQYARRPGVVVLQCNMDIDQKRNRVTLNIKQRSTSMREDGVRLLTGDIFVKSYEVDGVFEHQHNLGKESLVFYYHTRTKKKKDVECSPLLYIKVDTKMQYLAGIELNQPDYMYIEQLMNDKSLFGQYNAIANLRPSSQYVDVLERVINDAKLFYRIRIMAIVLLSNLRDGYQKLIQLFVKRYCLSNSTVVRPNDFSNAVNYFIQVGIIKAIGLCDPYTVTRVSPGRRIAACVWSSDTINESASPACNADVVVNPTDGVAEERDDGARTILARDVIVAFLNSILMYNDNESNVFDDSAYLATVIELLSFALCYSPDTSVTMDEWVDNVGPSANDRREVRSHAVDDVDDILGNNESEAHKFNESAGEELCASPPDEKFGRILEATVNIIEKHRRFDLIFPSVYNAVTAACLKTLGRLALLGHLTMNSEMLLQYSMKRNFVTVRLIVFELLIMQQDAGVIQRILDAIKGDPIRTRVVDLMKRMYNDGFAFLEEFKDVFAARDSDDNDGRAERTTIKIKSEWMKTESGVILIKVTNDMRKALACSKSTGDVECADPVVAGILDDVELVECVNSSVASYTGCEGLFGFVPKQIVQSSSKVDAFLAMVFALTIEKYGSARYSCVKEIISKYELLLLKYDGYFAVRRSKTSECKKAGREGDLLGVRINAHIREGGAKDGTLKFHVEGRAFPKDSSLDRTATYRPPLKGKFELLALIDKLSSRKESLQFQESVDYKSMRLFKYVDIVRIPTCIRKVREKLMKNEYANEFAFFFELRRIFLNCLIFNNRRSVIYGDAMRCLSIVDSFISDMVKGCSGGAGDGDRSLSELFEFKFFTRCTQSELNEIFSNVLADLTFHIGQFKSILSDVRRANDACKSGEFASIHDFLTHVKALICGTYSDQPSRSAKTVLRELKKSVSYYFGDYIAKIGFNVPYAGKRE